MCKMKIKKIIITIVAIAIFCLQQLLHFLGSPSLVTTWPSFAPDFGRSAALYYYENAVEISTIFSIVYVIMLLLLVWAYKKQ